MIWGLGAHALMVLEKHAWHALVTAWKNDIFGKWAFGHFGGIIGWQWLVQIARNGNDVLLYWKLMESNCMLHVWTLAGSVGGLLYELIRLGGNMGHSYASPHALAGSAGNTVCHGVSL